MRCDCWGEILTATAKMHGAGDAVIDGYNRDTTKVLERHWPIFSRGRFAQDSGVRTQVANYNCNIAINGVWIEPGDLLYEINSKKVYHETMLAIYRLMDKGETNLSAMELKKLAAMSTAAEKYQDEILGLKPRRGPETVIEVIELKMFENKLTQTKLATG